MNGLEFLQTIKSDHELKSIPVVILSSSNENREKQACFQLSAAGYMVKPVDYTQFVNVINTIHLYWTLSEFPQS
jgi:CheY-like chemotaxis protein